MYSHWGIKGSLPRLSSGKLKITKSEWGRQKTNIAPLWPIKLMLANRVYTRRQDFPTLNPRIRHSPRLPTESVAGGPEKNGASGWQTGFRKTRERKGKAHGNDHLCLRPGGEFLRAAERGLRALLGDSVRGRKHYNWRLHFSLSGLQKSNLFKF